MRIIGRIVGVQSTEQSIGIIVGAFVPTHKYKCRKVRQFVRVQKWRTFSVAKHTTKRSGGPFLVVSRLVSFVLALLFVLHRQFCRVQVGEYAGVDGFFFAVFFGIFSGILRDVVVEEFYKEAGVDICHGGES